MNPLLLPAFSMGLFGSLHCATMCGSPSSVLCAKKGRYSLAFNAGRIAGYTALGCAAGALGSWTVGHGIDHLRFAFRALAATTMLLVGLQLAGLPSFIHVLESIGGGSVWKLIAPVAARLIPLRSPVHALAAGALWSLMPCGLLYAALATSASAYSAFDGATTMGAFALGTLPMMLGVGAIASRLAAVVRSGWIRRAAGALVLLFGVWSTAQLAGQVGLLPFGALSSATCPH